MKTESELKKRKLTIADELKELNKSCKKHINEITYLEGYYDGIAFALGIEAKY